MRILSRRTGNVVHLCFEDGDALDSVSAPSVKAGALECLAEPAHLVVDLTGIEFVDSAGIGALVSIFKTGRARGLTIRLAGAHPNVRAVLEIIKLDQIFEVHDDAEALVRELAVTDRN